MSPRLKLTLQITGFLAAIALLGWAIWATFFRTPGASLVPGAAPGSQQGSLPTNNLGQGGNIANPSPVSLLQPAPAKTAPAPDTIARGGPTLVEAVSNNRSDFATLAGNGFNYYNASDGRFYRLSQQGGEPVKLSDEVFKGVEKVTWDGNGNQAVLEFPDGSNIYYDFKTKDKATLPKAGVDFNFSQGGNLLGYKYLGAAVDDRWLVISKPNGESQKMIEPLADENNHIAVNWSPNNQIVATFSDTTSSAGEEIFFTGLNNENFPTLQTNGLGFRGKWSPTGSQMLYSVYNEGTDYNPVLYAAGMSLDNIGAGNRTLRLNTWPDKCVFASDDLAYCAVPTNLEKGSGLYPELADTVPDVFYKVDLKNNLTAPLALPEAGDAQFNATNVMLSDSGDALFFTDRVSGRIMRLRLR